MNRPKLELIDEACTCSATPNKICPRHGTLLAASHYKPRLDLGLHTYHVPDHGHFSNLKLAAIVASNYKAEVHALGQVYDSADCYAIAVGTV